MIKARCGYALLIVTIYSLYGCVAKFSHADSLNTAESLQFRYEAARWVVLYTNLINQDNGFTDPVHCAAGSHGDMKILQQLIADRIPITIVNQTEPRQLAANPATDGATILSTEGPRLNNDVITVWVHLMQSKMAGQTYRVEFEKINNAWKVVRIELDSVT